MFLDAVQNLKAEVFKDVFDYVEEPSLQMPDAIPIFVPRTKRSKKKDAEDGGRDPREMIAVGIVPAAGNRRPDAFELAVLIQRNSLTQHPLIEALYRRSHGEMQLFKTGPAMRYSVQNGSRCRPLRIGSSVGHYRISAGSIGCFVRCRQNGGSGILSNNHVLAFTNRASVGDVILQPGRSDGGDRRSQADCVATLYRFIPILFDGAVNYVDCAFAILSDGVRYDASLSAADGSELKVGKIEPLLVGAEKVFKIGRTTGRTEGKVVAVSVDNIVVSMVNGDPSKRARFDRQIAFGADAGPFSKPGDSGSVVFTENGQPVGLLFAGTQSGGLGNNGVTYANPLEIVCESLEVDIFSAAQR